MSSFHLRPVPTPSDEAQAEPWDGVTHPTGGSSAGIFLTDVIVALNLATRERVEDAIGAARQAGTTPESILVERGDLTRDGLARAIAERHGLDFLDLGVFAVERGASDVHLEPDGTQLRVRFRIDGVLIETANVPRRMTAGVISRVKIMSDLDIAERRLPQDGRVGMTIDGHHVDLRVVTLPSVHG